MLDSIAREDAMNDAENARLTALSPLDGRYAAKVDALREQVEKVSLSLRERDKALERATIERDADAKRWHHELEMRLMAQKQAFVLERVAADKDTAALRANVDTQFTFDPIIRDNPCPFVEVDFIPCCEERLCTARGRQNAKLQCQRGYAALATA